MHSLEKNKKVSVSVIRNNFLKNISVKQYDKIVLSPGAGLPHEAGLLMPFIQEIHKIKPILGVCLGHQALGLFFGAGLKQLPEVLHGIQLKTTIKSNNYLFKNIGNSLHTAHYHSWVIDSYQFPNCLEITAQNDAGVIMAIQHKNYDINGIQFHPESVLTPCGDAILKNWVNA